MNTITNRKHTRSRIVGIRRLSAVVIAGEALIGWLKRHRHAKMLSVVIIPDSQTANLEPYYQIDYVVAELEQ